MHWKKELKKGKQFLVEKDFPKALRCFKSAVDQCPVSAAEDLERSVFFLGITLKKLGKPASALKCWHMGKQINKNGYSIKMIRRHSNEYGLPVTNQPDDETDKKAFIQIQLQKYLMYKPAKRFCSLAEYDVIVDIISHYWSERLLEGKIRHLSVDEKIRYFKTQKLVFPVSDINSLLDEDHEKVIFIDFSKKERQSMDDLCSCGSGNLFSQCCGRIKTYDDSLFEDF